MARGNLSPVLGWVQAPLVAVVVCSFAYILILIWKGLHPPKTNMEPENTPMEKEKHLSTVVVGTRQVPPTARRHCSGGSEGAQGVAEGV